MISPKRNRRPDPVEHWLRQHRIAKPAVPLNEQVRLPGGPLSLRTNSAEFLAYARRRYRYLIQRPHARAAAAAEVYCLPGNHWPAVRPGEEASDHHPNAQTVFFSFRAARTVCAWQPPTLMGCVRRNGSPVIRLVATGLNPRFLARPAGALRLKVDGTGITYANVLDLMLCLLAHSRGFSLLHGAVLEKEGRGILLAGASGCGKTTAALALARGGFRLLTDEYAVLWNRGPFRGRVSGVLVPPMLVGKPPKTLASLEQTLGQSKVTAKIPFPLAGPLPRERSLPLATILSLRRLDRRASGHQARRLSQTDALAMLMLQLLDPVRSGREAMFAALWDTVVAIPAYDVAVGRHLASLPEFVEKLAMGKGPSQGSGA
jgi:hypothetical protein